MNELLIIHDYVEAGFRVFPLFSFGAEGCECGDPKCTNMGKHPRVKAWQHSPRWSDEQLDNMLEHTIKTGFGVCLDDHLVIDVDPRNGGKDGYAKLCETLGYDPRDKSGFVVETGGGGWHVHFTRPAGSFVQQLPDYPGIDFKTSGFVVGCGSLHASGAHYERGKGFPTDMAPAPDDLLALIKRREYTRATVGGLQVDVTLSDLRDMLSYYKNIDLHYDEWLAVGMALHESTQGSDDGFLLWEEWSATSKKHNPHQMEKKWHSFGKAPNPITLGTLIHFAEQYGYSRPVTFPVDSQQLDRDRPSHELPFSIDHCDPLRPPGLVGKICEWIDRQCFYPRERLASIAAIVAVGNLAGLHWRDDITGVTTNLMALCVAGSGTGKEALQSSFFEIMRQGGMAATVHGDIKSKQEVIRNLIEHQPANYLTDEIGEILKTIENAKKRGGAAYLEGVTGEIMKIYTKAGDVLPVSGDVRRDMLADLLRRAAQAEKTVEDCDGKPGMESKAQYAHAEAERLKALIELIQSGGGLPRPFLSMLGFTTLESLEPALSVELAKNGFLNRAFIVEERDSNPKPNPRHAPCEFPYTYDLARIAATGNSGQGGRIEFYGEPRVIRTEPPAREMLSTLMDWQWEFAEWHRQRTGYEALGRRSYEFISKISTILAIADHGVRTVDHVVWAAAFVKRDIDEKIRLIRYVEGRDANTVEQLSDGLQARVLSLAQEPVYKSTLYHKLKRKGVTRESLLELVDAMVASGLLSDEGTKVVAR